MDYGTLLLLGGALLLIRSDAGQYLLGTLFPDSGAGVNVGGTTVPPATSWRIVSANYTGFTVAGGPVHADLIFSHRGPAGTFRFGFNVAPSRGITILPSGHEAVRATFETDVVVGDDATWTDYTASVDAPSSHLSGPGIGLLEFNWFDCQAFVADQAGHVYASQWDNRAIWLV